MKKGLKTVSKGIYILSVLSLFLPAFIPECTPAARKEVNTTSVTDTFSLAKDSVIFNTELKDINTASLEERSIFYPDRVNQSFLGYLLWNLFKGLIVIFTLLTIWSGVLRFKDQRDLETALQLSGALACLSLFIMSEYDKVVWGFWFTFGLTAINTLLNWRIWFLRSYN